MSLTSTITDIISEAHALLSEPVSLDGWQPIGHEIETYGAAGSSAPPSAIPHPAEHEPDFTDEEVPF